MELAAGAFESANVAELALGGGHAVGAAKEQAQFQDVWRIGDAVGGALFDGAQKERAIFGVTENQDGRVGGLGIDVVEKAETGLFGLQGGVAEIEEDGVGPGQELLDVINSGGTIGTKGEAVTKGTANGFAQAAIVTKKGNL